MPNCGVDAVRERLVFDSPKVEALIDQFQATGLTDVLGAIVTSCEPIAVPLIRQRRTMRYADEGELMSTINRKLLISLPQFDRV